MAVRKLKPVTPGQRHKVIGTFEDITASVPEKSLVYGKRSTGGRNNTGKMTVRYMGGGQEEVSSDRLQARERWCSSCSEDNRVRPEPFGSYRIAVLR